MTKRGRKIPNSKNWSLLGLSLQTQTQTLDMHEALSTEDNFTCSRGVRITRIAQFDWRVRLTAHSLNGAFGKEWLFTKTRMVY